MLASPPLLLADLADLARVVMPIIIVVIYGVAHLVGAMQQEKKKREQAAPRPKPEPDPFDMGRPAGVPDRASLERPAANPAPSAKPVTLEETLRREVEEFLRRAQGEAKPKPAAPKRPPQPQRQRPTPQKKAPEPQLEEVQPRRLVDAPGSLTSRAAESVADTSRNNLPTGAAVDAYVTEQMRGVASIGQHASRLGEEVALADDRMQAQLQQKFDHRVGTLAPVSNAAPKSAAATAAKEFRELLARPGGIRQVIIANEILRRPEERW
ncbi:hypothetical protein [Lacipirellula parvula]|uniref:Uncharacterized protein n=1 Tax=Lacipirellula parvula TaxID=2650471 RepID=A0A5K7XC76_9BACT|nr:hypothetical protein [Lacipirellula parvula]BBO30679.1 hypothetical protein PLANPX_0291 [Lacipirellula parvula]